MPTSVWGTLQLLDTLATYDRDNVFTYGEDRMLEHVNDLLLVHNAMTADLVGLLMNETTRRIDRFGADTVDGEMTEVDEFGAVDVKKVAVEGYNVGYPLRDYQYALGWTRKYFETKTPRDMAIQYAAATTADVKNLKREMMKALFRATNYTFIDRLTDRQSLPVKALINADGTDIPMDQYGNTFDGSTHTHLVGRAGGSLAASDITALVNNVVEHQAGGRVILFINKAMEATIRAFSANFDGYQAPLLSPGPGSTADIVDGGRKDDPYRIDDKPIGVWDGYVTIWIKPWMPNNYVLALVVGGGGGPVLRYRRRNIAGYGSFRMVAEHEHFPLRATHFEREFGISVYNRLGAAILYAGGTSYVAPTFA